MWQRYLAFVRGVSANAAGRAGVVLTTSTVLVWLAFEVLSRVGIVTNAYAGLLIYLLFPPLFVIGLLLVALGWYRLRRESKLPLDELMRERFGGDEAKPSRLGARVVQTVGALTLLNVLILGLAGMQGLRYMDSPEFCGTACHSVMNPEWTTYQVSPHARVSCTDCHVGEGPEAQLEAKMRGLYQVVSVTFDLYQKPIPTPVHSLRPARETCERCHWPDKFYGLRIDSFVDYEDDEESTESFTTLAIKIDDGVEGQKSGIHWHIAEENIVRYASVNDERQEMIWVEVSDPEGTRRYHNTELEAAEAKKAKKSESENELHDNLRTMDCVDCHNRATHIYEDPEDALNEALLAGRISRELPFVKREALAALTGDYATRAAADEGIADALRGFYRERDADKASGAWGDEIEQAIAVLRAIHARNIHPEMNIDWNTYPSLIGHEEDDSGCFRCHSPALVDDAGNALPHDCDLCHSIIAWGSDEQYPFL